MSSVTKPIMLNETGEQIVQKLAEVAESNKSYEMLLNTKADKVDVSAPFNFKGDTTYASLPTSGNAINDTYYCSDKKCRYTWNGEGWYQSSMNEVDYTDELAKMEADLAEVDSKLSSEIEEITNVVGGSKSVSMIEDNMQAYIETGNKVIANHSYYASGYFECEEGIEYIIKKNKGKTFRICTTSVVPKNGVSYIRTIANHNGTEITITPNENEKYVFVQYWLSTNDTDTKEEVLDSISIMANSKGLGSDVERNKKGVDFLQKQLLGAFCGKVIHFSVDDVNICLADIFSNNYSSIFDNSFLSDLKEIHEQTGAVFTLNAFVEMSTNNWNIANVTNKYANEFQSVKSWLKFAFHGVNSANIERTYDEMKANYNTFVNAIYTMTGTYDCVDTMPRLDYFYGTLNMCTALKDNANAPAIGLLSADDTRLSYYLDENQNEYLINKGKYFDLDNELVLIRSCVRMDSRTAEQSKAEILGNPCYQNFVEIFFHEQDFNSSVKTEILNLALWASENGYNNYYLCKVFD